VCVKPFLKNFQKTHPLISKNNSKYKQNKSLLFVSSCHNASMQNKRTMQSVAVSDVTSLDLLRVIEMHKANWGPCLVSFEFDNMLWEGELQCDPDHFEDMNDGLIVECEMTAPAHVEVAGMNVLMPR